MDADHPGFQFDDIEDPDPLADPKDRNCFGPPDGPIEVFCLHCGERYDSSLMEYRRKDPLDPRSAGFWRCPTPGCGGIGFGMDIYPTDPEWKDPKGLLHIVID